MATALANRLRYGFRGLEGVLGGDRDTVIRSMTVVGSSSVRICDRLVLAGVKLRLAFCSLRSRRAC